MDVPQQPENYSKDSSIISGDLKGIDNEMISITSSEKDDLQKLRKKEKNKENKKILIDSNKKENEKEKDDEDELSMGNMSKINHQLFGDESKNDDEIIKEMNDKDEINNKKEEDNNIDINLNINEMASNKEDKKEDKKKEAEIIQINDLKSELSLDLSKEEDKTKNKKEENKRKEINKKKVDISYVSKFSDLKKQKEEGFYDNDSNILKDDYSQISKNDNIYDLISENSDKANPPSKDKKKKQNLFDAPSENDNDNDQKVIKFRVGVFSSKANMKSSDDNFTGNKKKEEIDFDESQTDKKINIKTILNTNDELITLEEFSKKYKNYTSIYLADLKKHHILYYSFTKHDINNIYLKLSLFSISIILYFSLNTLFMTSSKMSNAYFDTQDSSPVYVLINLFLPFIICGIIIFLLKYFVIPNHYIVEIIKTIQGEKQLKEIVGLNEVENNVKKKNIPKEQKKRDIKNSRNKVDSMDVKIQNDYRLEKAKLEEKLVSLYPKYKKIVLIYFLVGFIFMGINWYMMTSFCAIYKNSGVKLIVNSIISLITSFIYPCLLGLVPSLIGFLAKKLNNKRIFKIYKVINIVL